MTTAQTNKQNLINERPLERNREIAQQAVVENLSDETLLDAPAAHAHKNYTLKNEDGLWIKTIARM